MRIEVTVNNKSRILSFCWLFISFTFLTAFEGFPAPDRVLSIPMRDGKELPAAVFFPSSYKGEKIPCILLRSPAGISTPYALVHTPIKENGYAVVIQATRSFVDAEGKSFPYVSDGWGDLQDGYDTIEWLANSSFCNGKVGTMGTSAMGITQMMLGPAAPPSLKCQHIRFAAASMYHHATYPGGQILKNQAERWLGYCARDPGVHSYLCNHPYYNDFWDQFNTVKVADRVQAPAVHIGGWFDTFIQGTIDGFISRQKEGGEGARNKQKLVIGPWHHYWPLSSALGDFQMPQAGINPPVDLSAEKWFEFYLKDVSNHIEELPAVVYYVMGPFDGSESSGNVWKTTAEWPPRSQEVSLYLTRDGRLAEDAEPEAASLSYTYQPNNPVPTIGGQNLFLESGPKDQSEIEKREDVIVFTTSPLTEDLEVTGRIKALIYATSSVSNTDISVRLSDVYPDGRSILIADGMYRPGVLKPGEILNEERPLEIAVDLWSTSLVFAKGHAIRVAVTSSNYPRYEKNPNIGLTGEYSGRFASAKTAIHMGKPFPSQIILPTIQNTAQKG